MPSPGLPVNIDSTYADDGTDPTVQLHQLYHDVVHRFINEFDTATRASGQVFVHNGSLFLPRLLASADVPVTTFDDELGTAYTFAAADAGKVKMTTSAETSAVTWTIPTNASVPMPVGTAIGVLQWGTGQITITGQVGVTLRSVGAAQKTSAQYARAVVEKVFTDTWLLTGSLGT